MLQIYEKKETDILKEKIYQKEYNQTKHNKEICYYYIIEKNNEKEKKINISDLTEDQIITIIKKDLNNYYSYVTTYKKNEQLQSLKLSKILNERINPSYDFLIKLIKLKEIYGDIVKEIIYEIGCKKVIDKAIVICDYQKKIKQDKTNITNQEIIEVLESMKESENTFKQTNHFLNFKEKYYQSQYKNEFINNRLNDLLMVTNTQVLGNKNSPIYNGFILPSNKICISESSKYNHLIIDDLNIYNDIFNFIDQNPMKYLSSEPMTIITIQDFLWEYFGKFKANIDNRLNKYDIDNDKTLISQFKNNNISSSIEKCAIAQNILIFLNISSEIIFGSISNKENEAFIILKSESKSCYILYDPQHPIKYNKIQYGIRVAKLTLNQYKSIKRGSEYIFDDTLIKKIYGNKIEQNNNEIKYNIIT